MKTFPFSAIVGLELARKSLVYHAIAPQLGGVVLMGHRGCAKTTMIRGFGQILSQVNEQDGSNCVEVPLGCTEDRLLGGVHADLLIRKGEWTAQKGLLEQAHHGCLYIDEINLLPDTLADLLLDSAATGQYRLERDGLSRIVESSFILVGSMNPDEGDLRPQLSDRFAHCIIIKDDFSSTERMEIAQRRMAFTDDREHFMARFDEQEQQIIEKIKQARQRLKSIRIPDQIWEEVADFASQIQTEGLRRDIAVVQTARCAAAWNSRDTVNSQDVQEAWLLCLGQNQLPHQNDQNHQQKKHSHWQREEETQNQNQTTEKDTDKQEQQSAQRHRSKTVSGSSPRESEAAVPISNHSDAVSKEFIEWVQSKNNVPDQIQQQPTLRRSAGESYAHWAQGKLVDWKASLLHALCRGWKPGTSGFTLKTKKKASRPAFYLFIDASRSTGMIKFLSDTVSLLKEALKERPSMKVNLLLLQDGMLSWKARRASKDKALDFLSSLSLAGGKSYLASGLKKFQRFYVSGMTHAQDKLIICSDGLASPEPGKKNRNTSDLLDHSMRHLSQSCTESAWVMPSAHKFLSSWLKGLCSKNGFKSFELGRQR